MRSFRRWAAGELDGLAHAFDYDGRSLCGLVESEDFSDELYGRCATCERIVGMRERIREKARKILGASWPRALSMTEVARSASTSNRNAEIVLEEIVEEGAAWTVETRAGYPRYAARRALVEEIGRTFGMAG